MKVNQPVTDQAVSVSPTDRILSTTDSKGRITYTNPDFERISGYSQAELLGQAHNIVRHPDMPSAAFADLWDHLKQQQNWRGLVKNRCKNGDYYWVDAFVTPIVDPQGQTLEYQSVRIAADANAVKRAERVYQRLHQGQRPLPPTWLSPTLALWGVGLTLFSSLALSQLQPTPWLVLLLNLMLGGGALAYLCHFHRRLQRLVRRQPQQKSAELMSYLYSGQQDLVGRLDYLLGSQHLQRLAMAARLANESSRLHQQGVQGLEDTRNLHDRIHTQHQHTEQISLAISQLNEAIAHIAEQASHIQEQASQVQHLSQQGRGQMHTLSQAISTLNRNLQASRQSIHSLRNSNEQISQLLNLIIEIAEQTNLLALNAAIEAARAGDQGRGFAVVADEVRKLAQRTQGATEEIHQAIAAVNDNTESTVAQMQAGHNSLEQALAHSAKLDEDLQLMLEALEHMAAHIGSTASATEQQGSACQDISHTLGSLSELAGSNRHDVARLDQRLSLIAEAMGANGRLAESFNQR
ncbi:methyl-accepting chemotaxis protein [Balneatrix alpica]|uniref:Methyl-accepting chemotaxis protein n=1 Tax=Balneatrix alpica TaxID=75684 RepID=A0ABV5ZBW9_9GAMM|nr:methyl-accepting chemotaxis protein [Balneatrix alpica]